VSILYELQKFFALNQDNSIEFWECSSRCNWSLHKVVDKETKSFNPSPLFLYKSSWDYSWKKECDELSNTWKMTFQASDLKEWHFLDLYDDDNNSIEPSNIKGSSWLKYFSYSNSLCARAIRVIMNHVPIGKYRLRFFPQESFNYLCGLYPIKMRQHILYECGRYNKYWNSKRDSICYFILFLEFNPNAFAFANSIR